MSSKKKTVHPYIPNSVPAVQQEMLEDIGVKHIDDLYADIPGPLRFKGRMNLPEALPAESDLKKHVTNLLARNRSCEQNISFLGGGCARHYVPAICDEINHRSEFLTAYAGEPYEDHGRFQSLFEYQSLMAELLDMDVVNAPTYDWCQAVSTSIRMAGRITKRRQVLVADTISPDRLSAIRNYCHPEMTVHMLPHSAQSGRLDLALLRKTVSKETAAVYFENPSYLGFIEDQGSDIAGICHGHGALTVVGVDPISLGVLKPPSQYGADIVCGDIQSLGIHIYFGGAQGGFIATRDEEKFVMQYPSRLFGIAKTVVPGEWGFGDVAYDRTSFGVREKGREFVGTAAALWGITAGVYLALMGPDGMREIGRTIMQKSQYLAKRLTQIPGVKAPRFASPFFKELVVDFNKTGMSVARINRYLLKEGIFGGMDLSEEFPDLGQSALYCVTEMLSLEDMERLIEALRKCLQKGKAKARGVKK